MELQKITVKLYAATGDQPKLSEFIPLFHRWIQQRALDELLIDVADYSHLPTGPGVILIGHEANYSIEYGAEKRLGVVCQSKKYRTSTNFEQLRYALKKALAATQELVREIKLQSKLHFPGQETRLTIGNRSLVANSKAVWERLKPDLTEIFDQLYPDQSYALDLVSIDPRERFAFQILNDKEISIATLRQRLNELRHIESEL